ncbi:hypothetical protein LXL04_029375 [Taraxacum kok-saghyz]
MERINVAVRARPLSPEDAKCSPWRISDNSILLANPTTKFEFDRIFREDCRTVDVYESRTKAIVSAAIGGFNGTVFAYGQTNSGKTHTMRGSSVEPGVIPLAVHDLFDMIQQDVDREFLLRMSYMEIYNEEINDLLAPEHRKLQIHESIERGIFVAGLKEEIVSSPKQVLEFMDFGEAHRHIGETNMNLHSSRSHTIFRMIIESRDKVEDDRAESSCDAVRVSVLNLVDLAGSERAAKTGAEGVRLKEGSHINKSLMTLGTVIKKLSEGAESQGGHVPYRDSKLTRILQPALGGNANTAIICNITLAQIHADETKSSLQFASRALRVTNCVHVNEILTDAALLKRQKKEIEELRAKLQGSHSEHLGDEILNLRNTLLQSELERERIALELEEEKKAQAERDKMLQVQAKKIQNLSSMVLSSSRDEDSDHNNRKKEKRRDTWCPGKPPKKMMNELPSTIPTQDSAMKPGVRSERERGPLVSFEDLVNENTTSNACKQERDFKSVSFCESGLPDARSLMHVTSRKKGSNRKKSLPTESGELTELKAEYEKLLLEFEAERTMNKIQIDNLTRRLADATSCLDEEPCVSYTSNSDISLTELEASVVIKQLEEKISVLEMEKASSLQNLESVVELETEKDKEASNKYEKLYMELMAAKEEACLANQQLTSSMDEDFEALTKLSTDIQEITFEIQQSMTLFESQHMQSYSAISDLISEVRSFSSHDLTLMKTLLGDYEKVNSCLKSKVHELECEKNEDSEELTNISANIQEITFEIQQSNLVVDSIPSIMDEHLQSCSALIAEVKSFSSIDFAQIKTLLADYETLHSSMKAKIEQLESEKLLMYNQSEDLQKRLQEACLSGENSSRDLTELSEHYETKVNELITEIRRLENEIGHQSTSVLAKEKETMRKDLEKTKVKLKETESKLRNTIQEKTKLESEKASAEREIKRLHSQKTILERDGRRRDSVLERNSNVFDPKKGKGFAVNIDQEEYRKLEVLAFEMERTIASLEEQLTIANDENQQAVLRSESLVQEVEDLTDKLGFTNSKVERLQETISSLRANLEEAGVHSQNADSSISRLMEEKEEMAMQLTDALLAIEEERAIWSNTQKASIEAIESKSKSYTAEIASLTNTISEVSNELEACRQECQIINEKLDMEKACSAEKSLEVEQLKNDIVLLNEQKKISENKLQNQIVEMTKKRDEVVNLVKELKSSSTEQQVLMERRNEELMNTKAEVEELTMKLSTLEAKTHKEGVKREIEKAKLRMRLNGAQTRLDGMRARCTEEMAEKEYMHKKFEEATNKLKEQLVSCRTDNMNLKKQFLLKE